jgi:Bacterial antitoxin of type II TA system, VapB
MRITVDIEDELYVRAQELAGQDLTPEDLIHEALGAFVRVQVAKRLAALEGR